MLCQTSKCIASLKAKLEATNKLSLFIALSGIGSQVLKKGPDSDSVQKQGGVQQFFDVLSSVFPSFLPPKCAYTKLSRIRKWLTMNDSFPRNEHLRDERKIQFRLPQLDQCMFQSPVSFSSNIDRDW